MPSVAHPFRQGQLEVQVGQAHKCRLQDGISPVFLANCISPAMSLTALTLHAQALMINRHPVGDFVSQSCPNQSLHSFA